MNPSIVWVYKSQKAESDTLKISYRLAKKNLLDAGEFFVFGDKPRGFHGHFFSCPRVRQDAYVIKAGQNFNERWVKWVDSIWKLQAIIENPMVSENFLWLYDDTFICQPMNSADLCNPWYKGFYSNETTNENSNYRKVMRRTFDALGNRGLSKLNFSSHAPMLYNKTDLARVIAEFECLTRPRLIESVYGNAVKSNPIRIDPSMFQYVNKRREFPDPIPKIVNVANGSYGHHREKLIELLK